MRTASCTQSFQQLCSDTQQGSEPLAFFDNVLVGGGNAIKSTLNPLPAYQDASSFVVDFNGGTGPV